MKYRGPICHTQIFQGPNLPGLKKYGAQFAGKSARGPICLEPLQHWLITEWKTFYEYSDQVPENILAPENNLAPENILLRHQKMSVVQSECSCIAFSNKKCFCSGDAKQYLVQNAKQYSKPWFWKPTCIVIWQNNSIPPRWSTEHHLIGWARPPISIWANYG